MSRCLGNIFNIFRIKIASSASINVITITIGPFEIIIEGNIYLE